MAVLEQRIKRSNVQYRSKSEKKKGEKRRDVSLKLKQAGMGGVGEQKSKKMRWKGEQKREQQLRGKEGTTCFAVSLTPAIIHRERPFISCWTWRMEREREQCSPGLLAALLMLAPWTLARPVKKNL